MRRRFAAFLLFLATIASAVLVMGQDVSTQEPPIVQPATDMPPATDIPTPNPTDVPTNTPEPSATALPSATPTGTETATATETPTLFPTATETSSPSETALASATATGTGTATAAVELTAEMTVESGTFTPTATGTQTATATLTPTGTLTSTPTETLELGEGPEVMSSGIPCGFDTPYELSIIYNFRLTNYNAVVQRGQWVPGEGFRPDYNPPVSGNMAVRIPLLRTSQIRYWRAGFTLGNGAQTNILVGGPPRQFPPSTSNSSSATLTTPLTTNSVYIEFNVGNGTGLETLHQLCVAYDITIPPVYPNLRGVVDNPAHNTIVRSPFYIQGWAFDDGIGIGSGPGTPQGGSRGLSVHQGNSCTGTVIPVSATLEGTYELPRPDVQAHFNHAGDNSYLNVGFSLPIYTNLTGLQTFTVCARSKITPSNPIAIGTRTVRIAVSRMVVDSPAANAMVTPPFNVVGWALDTQDDPNGPGITEVRVHQGATCSGTLLGQDLPPYNSRPDVAAHFGLHPSYGNSGYSIRITPPVTGSFTYRVCAYRTENNQPVLTIAETRSVTVNAPSIESQLQAYGVQLSAPGTDPNFAGNIAWTDTEKQQVLQAVQDIANAFVVAMPNTGSPQDVFRREMGIAGSGVNPRGDIYFTRLNTGAICQTYNNYAPVRRTITCGNLFANGSPRAITRYVIVHELGHIFDNQADQNGGTNLAEYVAETRGTNGAILDSQGLWVMGNYNDTINCPTLGIQWRRGERGWGSGPGSTYQPTQGVTDRCAQYAGAIYTDFQQNPPPYPNNDAVIANQETAADMFLNWVYRVQQTSTQDLGGFENVTWKPDESDANGYCNRPSGCADVAPQSSTNPPPGTARLSGDARFGWMSTRMSNILNRP